MASAISVWTLRAGIADRTEYVENLRDGLLWRQAIRRISPGDIHRVVPRMRIGTILGPSVLLAFVDGACLLQHVDRPPAVRPDGRPSFVISIEITPAGTNPYARLLVPGG